MRKTGTPPACEHRPMIARFLRTLWLPRNLFAAPPELLTPLLRSVHRIITGFLLKMAGLKRSAAATGAVTLIQRFGSTADLNIPRHGLVPDGLARPVFA